MRRKNTIRNVPLDLDEILGEAKTKEPVVTTSIRLPVSMAERLDEIAKARKMSRTKLMKNLIAALIRDYEEKHGSRRR